MKFFPEKGNWIQEIRNAEYLQPINKKLNIENKQDMFAIRNIMVDVKSNFNQKNKKPKCICGQFENMEHIWNCQNLNLDEI